MGTAGGSLLQPNNHLTKTELVKSAHAYCAFVVSMPTTSARTGPVALDVIVRAIDRNRSMSASNVTTALSSCARQVRLP